jgi:amino acid adenylation domain-containing protein
VNELLHTRFENFAKSNAKINALKCNEDSITYGELNEKSNLIANALIQKGVQNGDIIPILFHRSIDVISVILGVLKSGAAYLPLDPSNPLERINQLLEESNTNWFICEEKLSSHLLTISAIPITLNTLIQTISNESELQNQLEIPPDSPAVVLFTSGTTGTPKGVILSHKGLQNRINWGIKEYQHTASSIFLHQTTLTFDFSIFEIFTSLSCGGTLIIARPEFHLEGKYLIELIKKEEIQIIGIVPTVLKLIIGHEDFKECTSLTHVFLGGEIVTPQLQSNFFKRSNARLINIYGPSETSISVLHWECKPSLTNKLIPIGYPIASMQVCLLDEQHNEVEVSKIGEIYIAGVGLARGYLNHSTYTEEKFVELTINQKKERYYRTGDYAKKSNEGYFLFEGRKDKQYKLNGIRIDLEEIENELKSSPTIQDCIVTVSKSRKGVQQLIAYLVLEKTLNYNVSEIIQSLSLRLPGTHLPHYYEKIDKIPLLINGKVDYNALPTLSSTREKVGKSFVAPQNPIQFQLKNIWEKVLEIDEIGINDPFDSLGGDSLKRIEIYELIGKEIQEKLEIHSFIMCNTIAEQAAVIEQKMPITKRYIIPLRAGNATPIIIIQPVQSEGIVIGQRFNEYLPTDHPVFATIPFGVNSNNIPKSIDACATIYFNALLSECDSNEFILGGHSMGGIVALELAKRLHNNGKHVKFLFILDMLHPTLELKDSQAPQWKNKVAFYYYKLKHVKGDFWKPTILNVIKWLPKEILKKLKLRKHFMNENKNLSLVLEHKLGNYPGKVIYFIAQTDRRNQEEWEQYNLTNSEENIQLWKSLFLGENIFYEIYGNHLSIIRPKEIEQICNLLKIHLRD